MCQRSDWALFRKLNTLSQKAGVVQKTIPQLVASELMDNALDSADRILSFKKSIEGLVVI
jgi:hypothetical protein